MTSLGHIVYYVRELARSQSFYEDVVGLEARGRIFGGSAVMLTGGSKHHELLLIEVGDAEDPPGGKRIGLYHAGWCIGDDIEILRERYNRIIRLGYTVDGLSDHTVSKSIYLRDPDGNEVELYIDDPGIDWQNDDSWMQQPVKPLQL